MMTMYDRKCVLRMKPRAALWFVFVSILVIFPVRMSADDFGMWYSVGADKKINKKWSLGGETEFRTRNNTRTADRWSVGIDAQYKLVKHLKISGGYTFLYDNNIEKISYKEDGSINKWTPSYWGTRHRFNLVLTGDTKVGRCKFTLRERWQYTWRPEAKDKKYDIDGQDTFSSAEEMDALLGPVKGKGRNVLRSRLKVDYDIPKCKVDPFVSAELFSAHHFNEKIRCMAGVGYTWKKQHAFTMALRYQDVGGDDGDMELNSWGVNLSYKFKF